jgi:hypothetical protein
MARNRHFRRFHETSTRFPSLPPSPAPLSALPPSACLPSVASCLCHQILPSHERKQRGLSSTDTVRRQGNRSIATPGWRGLTGELQGSTAEVALRWRGSGGLDGGSYGAQQRERSFSGELCHCLLHGRAQGKLHWQICFLVVKLIHGDAPSRGKLSFI